MSINVVLTCVGSQLSTGIIKALKHSCLPIRVVGVDMNEDAVGRFYTDAFYSVPAGNEPDYFLTLLDICRRENVQVVITGSDEEAYALSQNLGIFEQMNVVCTVPSIRVSSIIKDKITVYEWLSKKGVSVPNYYTIGSAWDLSKAAIYLGFPDKPFIIKPSASRGGRGVWLIHPEGSSVSNLFNRQGLNTMTLEGFLKAMNQSDEIPSLMAMEYLTGDAYDVDVLAQNGEVLYMVPRRRLNSKGIPFTGCVFDKNPEVYELAYAVQEALSLHYLYDFDITLSENGRACLMEINPRLSGGIIGTLALGVNLMEYLVRLAVGMEIPIVEVPYGKTVYAKTLTVAE